MPKNLLTTILLIAGFIHYSATATASVPLVMELNMVGENLRFWWKTGHFVTGNNDKYLQPLTQKESNQPPTGPEWIEMGKSCPKQTTIKATLGKSSVKIKASNFKAGTRIQMFRKKMLVAENVIAHPMDICSMHLLQADELIGPELIILWKLRKSANGLTIFRIPESLQ